MQDKVLKALPQAMPKGAKKMVNNPYDNYKRTQVETASPGQLLLMLYSGALKNLRLAEEDIQLKEVEQTHNHLMKAQDIVMELNRALNMDTGEIAANLRSLYLYITNRLAEANMKKDAAAVQEAILLLSELKQGWDSVVTRRKTLSLTTRPAGK